MLLLYYRLEMLNFIFLMFFIALLTNSLNLLIKALKGLFKDIFVNSLRFKLKSLYIY
jgi:uncharacterized membrane-anchored protein